MKRKMLIVLAMIAVAVGVWHGYIARQAFFVFREDEPITSWLAVLLGPSSTLLASVVAVFLRKTGGVWLIASGIAAFGSFLIGEGQITEHVPPFLLQISIPMIALGAAFILVEKYFGAGMESAHSG